MGEKIEVDIKVPNQTRYLSLIGRIGEDIARTMKRFNGDRDELAYHLNLVLTEAMANTIRHANEGDPTKTVHITISIQGKKLAIKVFDQGQGFDINTLAPPDFECLEERGRGIFIIRSLMDKVSYRRTRSGHILEMLKKL
jgi:serine/threonine-protein kinase RsbW